MYISKYLRNFRFNSVLVWYFVLLVLIVEIPMVASLLLLRREYNTAVLCEVEAAYDAKLHQAGDIVDLILRQATLLAWRLVSPDNSTIRAFLNAGTEVAGSYEFSAIVDRVVAELGRSRVGLFASICVFSPINGYLLHDSGHCRINQCEDAKWVVAAGERVRDSEFAWYAVRPFGSTWLLSFLFRTEAPAGVVVVNIDFRTISELLVGDGEVNLEELFILDATGGMVYSSTGAPHLPQSQDPAPIELKPLRFASAIRAGELPQFARSEDGASFEIRVPLRFRGWQIGSIGSLDALTTTVRALDRVLYLIICAGFVMVFILSFVLSIRLYRPIEDIIAILDSSGMARGVFSDHDASNEFSLISTILQSSLERTQKAEERLTENLTRLRRTQTAALHMQIHPHLLYNTLNTIRWLAFELTGTENKACVALSLLREMLLLTLDTQREIVPLSDEVRHASLHIELLKLRFPGRFAVHWHIEPQAANVPVPSMILQPVIENAVVHGVLPLREKVGSVRIAARSRTTDFNLIIEDDGVGLDKARMEEVTAYMRSNPLPSGRHVGLLNVYQRLRLHFGGRADVRLAHRSGGGTVVTCVIPTAGHEDGPPLRD